MHLAVTNQEGHQDASLGFGFRCALWMIYLKPKRTIIYNNRQRREFGLIEKKNRVQFVFTAKTLCVTVEIALVTVYNIAFQSDI
jgi:hypothetical protein